MSVRSNYGYCQCGRGEKAPIAPRNLLTERWKKGKWGGAIVSDTPLGDKDLDAAEHVESYGGYLVCESVPPKHRSLIVAAPQLLEALEELKQTVIDTLLPNIKGEGWLAEQTSVLAVFHKVDAAIAEARGEG